MSPEHTRHSPLEAQTRGLGPVRPMYEDEVAAVQRRLEGNPDAAELAEALGLVEYVGHDTLRGGGYAKPRARTRFPNIAPRPAEQGGAA